MKNTDCTLVSATELARHTGAILGRLRNGEQLTLTFGGWPVAELRPISPGYSEPSGAVSADA